MPPKISLEAARVNAKLTQEKAAELIGINKWMLLRWEKNPASVKVQYLPKIESVYRYPVDFIIFE